MKLPSQYPVLDDRPIDKWKVTELKEELKRRKMMTKGLKEDLIKRLDEAIRNEIESAKGNTDNSFDGTPQPPVETENAGTTPADPETTGNLMHHGNKRNDVDGEMACITTVPLGEQKVQEEEVMHGFNYARDEEMVVHATSVETSIMVNVNLIPELEVNVQESQKDGSQKGGEDLKLQPENEQIKASHDDLELNFSDANQVSEVSTVFGFQVKSDSISSDCVSTNEKNELKDNIITDNVKLELEDKLEIVQPSSNNVIPDVGKLHPVDVEVPLENKVPVEESDDKKADNAETSEKNDSADVFSSEKLNLDRSSGDNSLEDEVLESKQIGSKYNSDVVGDRSEKTEIPVVKEGVSLHGMQDDITVDEQNIYDENKDDSAAPILKRKLHDIVVGNNETSKRQRRWNSENLRVPEPQSNTVSSTSPKETFSSMTLKCNFSRSDSNNSEDAPKERVVPQSLKPPTNSLRIDCFLRPFTLKAVQELLGKSGNVTSFWMDNIKTHCYVTYSSVEEAIETRNAVYNLQWPPNGGRLLVAEFVDPQEVKLRMESPLQSPATPVNAGRAIPPAPSTLQAQPLPGQLVQRQHLPPPPSLPPPLPLARERLPVPPPPQAPKKAEKVDPTIVTLDDLFRKTKATPRIYYLPLSDDQVAAKLKTTGKKHEAVGNLDAAI